MNKFTFALPNGKFFTLSGPSGSTIAQAERIFLEQLSAGSFVGLAAGDTLQPIQTEVVRFALSRLERGTASTADLPLLAIYNDGRFIVSALPVLDDVQVENGITTADFLGVQPVTRPIGQITPALTNSQTQAIMAQIASNVCQRSTEISQAKGLGKYGFNLPQLEETGLIKPGTGSKFAGLPTSPGSTALPNPDAFLSTLNSPKVWTGKYGVRSLDDLLSNEPLQDRVQYDLLEQSFNSLVEAGQIITPASDSTRPVGQVYNGNEGTFDGSLVSVQAAVASRADVFGGLGLAGFSLAGLIGGASGIFNSLGPGTSSLISQLGSLSVNGITGAINPANLVGGISALANRGVADLGGLLANASKFGVDTAVQWAKGQTPTSELTSQLNQLSKQGQFAINFSDFKLPNIAQNLVPAAAFKGTVNRNTVDLAVNKLIGNPKVPTPGFGEPFPQDLSFPSLKTAINSATALLKSPANALLGQATSAAGSLARTAQQVVDAPGGVITVPGLQGITNSSPTPNLSLASVQTAAEGLFRNIRSG